MMHPQHEEWMEYLYGEIEPQRQELLTDHLQQCLECRGQVSTWRSAMRGLDGWKWANGGSGQVRRYLQGATRWAAVVVLILTLGIVIGRFSAASPNMDQLQQRLEMSLTSSLEPTIRQNITEDLNRDWLSILAASRAQFREDIQKQFRNDLNEFAVETFNASNTLTNQLLTELIQSFDAAQIQHQYWVMQALDQMEEQRLMDDAMLQNNLELLAMQTGEGFQKLMTGKDIKDKEPEVIKNNVQVNQE